MLNNICFFRATFFIIPSASCCVSLKFSIYEKELLYISYFILFLLRILERYSLPYQDKAYETLFDSVKNKYKLQENSSLSYEKGIIKLTNFGLNFIEICIS